MSFICYVCYTQNAHALIFIYYRETNFLLHSHSIEWYQNKTKQNKIICVLFIMIASKRMHWRQKSKSAGERSRIGWMNTLKDHRALQKQTRMKEENKKDLRGIYIRENRQRSHKTVFAQFSLSLWTKATHPHIFSSHHLRAERRV